jgi:acetyltransferase-like isoleucine patch superfamily enzyme
VPLVSACLFALYRVPRWRLRQAIRWLLYRLEGGSMFSITLRRIFARYHGVEVGMYTHGGWLHPFHLDAGTRVGRYTSIAETAWALTHDHPIRHRSTSGLFFNPHFGLVDRMGVQHGTLEIGSDVWIGHNAIVLPSVRSIGDGAVVGAGAVVARDVPPFAIVTGHPARVVGYRFDEATIQALLRERWWDRPLEELAADLDAFRQPLGGAP